MKEIWWKMSIEEEEDIASVLVLLGIHDAEGNKRKMPIVKEEEHTRKKQKKASTHLTLRKYDRERKRARKLGRMDQHPLPLDTDNLEAKWPHDGHYYRCRVTDFIQIDDNTVLYDVEFIDDDIVLENVEARHIRRSFIHKRRRDK